MVNERNESSKEKKLFGGFQMKRKAMDSAQAVAQAAAKAHATAKEAKEAKKTEKK